MNTFVWLGYILLGVVIVAPLIQSDIFNVDKKYKHFKYVSFILAIWWIVDVSRQIINDGILLYYLTLLIFPIVFLFVFGLFVAIRRHFNSNRNNILIYIGLIFFAVNLIVALTNKSHELYFSSNSYINFSFEDALTLKMNNFFYVHTLMAYVYLMITIFYIMKHVTRRARNNSDNFPLILIISSIILGVAVNVFHIFVNTFTMDPTLITVTIVLSVLYYVFYIRDLKLLLGFNRNRFIIDNLREQYVIVDELHNVIDASTAFKKTFHIDQDESLTFDELKKRMQEKAILFEESDNIVHEYNDSMMYFNTVMKPIYLPFYNKSGSFYLFYDQTSDVKYIYDMNYIKTHDLMTKIYNRNFLEDIRDNLDNENVTYQIVLFDLDGLKLFNDYLGHNQGDDLLIRFANQLKRVSEDKEVFPIRLGGDEFLLLFINKDDNYVKELLKQLQNLNEPLPFIEKIQYSFASSKRDEKLKNMKSVLAFADREMYKMKSNKSNYKELLENELKKITKK